MLTAEIGVARKGASALTRRGLAARPSTTVVTPENRQSPYQGDWVLTIGAGPSAEGVAAWRGGGCSSRALALAHGSLARTMTSGSRSSSPGRWRQVFERAHQVSDWVIIADPLFSIELMDRRRRAGHETVHARLHARVRPVPGGRVVVTTNWVTDLAELGGKALDDRGPRDRAEQHQCPATPRPLEPDSSGRRRPPRIGVDSRLHRGAAARTPLRSRLTATRTCS